MGVLLREIGSAYQAYAAGTVPALPPLPIQYADFALWQRDWLSSGTSSGQLDYWKRQLAGVPPTLELPVVRPAADKRAEALRSTIPETLTRAVRTLGRQEGATLFMTLLSAFAVLLHRRTGCQDLVIGTDMASRNHVETEGLIGFFINQLPLRIDASGNPAFRELLGRVRETCVSAYAHQDVPFEWIVREVAPGRSLSRTPLFQTLFVVQEAVAGAGPWTDITASVLDFDTPTSKFDIGLFIIDAGSELVATWRYRTSVFDPVVVESMARRFEHLLAAALAQPEDPIHALDPAPSPGPESKLAQLRSGIRKPVSTFAPVTMELLDGRGPLVLESGQGDVELGEYAAAESALIESKLEQHGAILFRGFGIDSAERFESFATTVCGSLYEEYGDLPRQGVGGKVYGSTPYPSNQPILFHNESSHLHCWPRKILFCCLQPAASGGETPIADCRRVLTALPEAIRERMTNCGLRYDRNFTPGLDVSWQQFFGTQDRTAVEAHGARSGIVCHWKLNGGLRTQRLCRAVTRHPQTGEMAVFNQIQAHHIGCLEPEVRRALQELFGPEDLPRNVYWGDGAEIEPAQLQAIMAAYQQQAIRFPWQRGDVLLLDNMLMAHARAPYTGERKIVVAMGEIVNESEA
jgi:alpha-ketoglutarate-dependent taurine dioxygenase